jgi:folylpolyglutamate synthase
MLDRPISEFDSDGTRQTVYFRTLTLMSVHILREHVDVAIYEVGVGGELDSTSLTSMQYRDSNTGN